MATSVTIASTRPRGRPVAGRLLLLAPISILYGLLMVVPLGFIVKTSLDGGFAHYRDVTTSPVIWHVVRNTLVISSLTTLIAVALAYLYAAALWRAGAVLRAVLLGLVLLPFWTGVLVKNFAWAALLQDNGVVIEILRSLGLVDQPITLLHNRFAVVVGMVHYVLPYAVFPIYSTMLAIDPRLLRAARSLGARPLRAIWEVVVPLSLPGVLSAALLVFIVSTGFFITPVLLGAPSDMMIANLVDFYANQIVDFGAAAALSVLIAISVSALAIAYQRVPKEGQYGAL